MRKKGKRRQGEYSWDKRKNAEESKRGSGDDVEEEAVRGEEGDARKGRGIKRRARE